MLEDEAGWKEGFDFKNNLGYRECLVRSAKRQVPRTTPASIFLTGATYSRCRMPLSADAASLVVVNLSSPKSQSRCCAVSRDYCSRSKQPLLSGHRQSKDVSSCVTPSSALPKGVDVEVKAMYGNRIEIHRTCTCISEHSR